MNVVADLLARADPMGECYRGWRVSSLGSREGAAGAAAPTFRHRAGWPCSWPVPAGRLRGPHPAGGELLEAGGPGRKQPDARVCRRRATRGHTAALDCRSGRTGVRRFNPPTGTAGAFALCIVSGRARQDTRHAGRTQHGSFLRGLDTLHQSLPSYADLRTIINADNRQSRHGCVADPRGPRVQPRLIDELGSMERPPTGSRRSAALDSNGRSEQEGRNATYLRSPGCAPGLPPSITAGLTRPCGEIEPHLQAATRNIVGGAARGDCAFRKAE